MTDVLLGYTIQQYYRLIDDQKVEAVLDLFDETAVYQRADAVYEGKPAIACFFRNDRKIRGRHDLEQIYSLGHTVVAQGRFEGRGEAGDARSIGFADFWTFNANGLAVHRRTYLATGYEVVQR